MNQPASADPSSDELLRAEAYLEQGNIAAAAAIASKLLAAGARDHETLQLAGTAAFFESRYGDAMDCYRGALTAAKNPQQAGMALNGIGHVCLKMHYLTESEDAFSQAMRTDPSNVGHALDFAQALTEGRKFDLAMEILRSAIKRHPGEPAPYVRLGNVLVNAGRQRDALVFYDEALRRNPSYAPAHFNASVALTMLGNSEAALDACKAALQLNPELDGYYHLANLGGLDATAEMLERLEKRADGSAGASINTRIDAYFALVQAHERRGDYDRAFAALESGNRLKRSTFQFDVRATEESVNRVTALFTADMLQRFVGKVESSLQPIFIVGMPRSGSTLIEQILAAHPQVRAGGELRHMVDLAMEIGEVWGARGEASPGSDEQVIADLRDITEKYTRLTAPVRGENLRFTDKLPGNFMFLGLLHLMFPQAVFVNTRRDAIATCFSCYDHLFTSDVPYAYDFGELGAYYRLYERMMAHWRQVLPAGKLLDVVYEDMVDDTETRVRGLLAHCQLPYAAECLEFHKVKRTVTTASAWQVRQPLYTSSVERWQHYRAHLGPLAAALGMELPPPKAS